MSSLYSNIKSALDKKHINYKEFRHKAVFTSEEAAKVRGNSLEEGAKALIFISRKINQKDKQFIQIVIQGNKRVDKEKFKSRFGFEMLKMASSEEVETISGVKPGAVPPFGNLFKTPITVFVEAGIIRTNDIEFNAGDHKISIRMKTGDWVKLVKPILGKFAEKTIPTIENTIKQEVKMLEAPKLQNPPEIIRKKIVAHKYIYALTIAFLAASFFLAGYFIKTTLDIPAQSTEKADKENQETKEVLGAADAMQVDQKPKLETSPPEVSAIAYGIYDMNDDLPIYTKNPDLQLPPASVTKVMTAIVAMDEYELDKPVYIPANCTTINASKAGFMAGDTLSLEDVLYGLLVRSGADAACAIASLYNKTDFVDKMNQKADEIGMEKTIFENSIGLDSDKFQFSTVNDLEKLAKYSLKYGTFRKIVGTKESTIRSLTNPNRTYKITNTNDLLFTIPGTVGIKTGFTSGAKECLIYLYEDGKHKYLIIVLGSQDRFKDTTKLLNWTKDNLQ